MKLPPHLSVQGGHLVMGQHDLVGLAQEQGTPLYVTDEQRICDNYTRYQKALASLYPKSKVLYAAKANGNVALLRALGKLGAGADVFSPGELGLALSCLLYTSDAADE